MPGQLDGRNVAFLATDGVEQVELDRPWQALKEAGARPELISNKPDQIQGFKHWDRADTRPVDKTVEAADPDDYDALVLPGGVINGDSIRMSERAVRFTRSFFDAGKPVGAICHGLWILTDADVARGRTMTSWPSLKTDLRNAGATWVDREVVVDQGLVSSRKPDDLPAFCGALVEEIAKGRHRQPAGV